MKKIKQFEISEITSNIQVSTLRKLQEKFPDLSMSFGVELFGSKEHGNTTGIDDRASIETLRELSAEQTRMGRDRGAFKTAVHLNYDFANMFSIYRELHESPIWRLVRETKVDKLVWNFFTLTDEQKKDFHPENFYTFLRTKANPNSAYDYDKLAWGKPELYNAKCAYIRADYYIEVQPSVREMLFSLTEKNYTRNPALLNRVKGLYVAKSFDEWRAVPKFGEYGDCRYLESWIIPQSWAGGVKPDNTKTALSVLADKVNYKIDRIDLSARSGAMTDGKSDIDKIEAIMQNANEWQEEINQKLNYGHSM